MRIDGIHIKNFLSFDTFEWTNLDPDLNLIVGPNSSGKTNLIHALQAIKDVVNPDSEQQKSLWSQSAYRGSNQVPIEISLDIQFTEAWEKELLSTFLAASLCNNSVIRDAINALSSGGNIFSSEMSVEQTQLSATLQNKFSPDNLEWLFTGHLVVAYKGINTWTSWYESRSNAQPFRLSLDGSSFYDDSVMKRYLQILLTKQELFTPDSQMLLRGISSLRSGIALRVEYEPISLATHQAFEQLASVNLTSTRFFGALFVFHTLLERSLVLSENTRIHPQSTFSYVKLRNKPINISNGEQMARYLFLKKNGSQTERTQYKSIQKLFCKITGRSFDVGFDPLVTSTQLNTDNPDIALSIRVSNNWVDIPLAFSGAGRAEALFISTLIADGNDQVILLDEPALNMHITMQKMLLDEILTHNGKSNQFILVTHSPTLVPPDAITKVSRFFTRQGHSCRVALDRGSMGTEEFASLEKELRRSTDVRALLFSRGVILVEGETEQGAFPVWYEKRFNRSLEQENITVFSVNSDTNFDKYVRFLQQFEIPWAIICDGKVIGDRIASNTVSRIIRQLRKAGVSELPDCTNKDFPTLCKEFEAYGIFTLAQTESDEIEALEVFLTNDQEAKEQVGDSKVRKSQYIATTHDCPDEVATLLEKAMQYLDKQESDNLT